jgi:hypothetical protein
MQVVPGRQQALLEQIAPICQELECRVPMNLINDLMLLPFVMRSEFLRSVITNGHEPVLELVHSESESVSLQRTGS